MTEEATRHTAHVLRLPDRTLELGPLPVVMGILNVTPDSFSDGGKHEELDAATAAAFRMANEGASIIDVGGESTRPGSEEVETQVELDRVLPVIARLRQQRLSVPVSIDTYKALVADQAVQNGATIINDVYGAQREPEIADVAALYDLPLIAMHWDKARDTSKDIISEIKRYFDRTIEIADKAGLGQDQLVLDPGFGFAKNFAENYVILRRLPELADLGFPLLIGTSRKSMIGKLLDIPSDRRVAGTVATSVLAYQKGGHIFRVHDVVENWQALQVAHATLYTAPERE